MAVERTYNVPLRREFLKVPRYKRAKTAMNALKRFLSRHMKSEEVYIGKRLNEEIWKRGIKNPPHHVKVDVVKEDDSKVYAELSGFKYEKPVIEEEAKAGKKEKAELKEGEKKIEQEFEKLEKKTEKIKEEKAKKGEEKEKKLEKMEKEEAKAEKEKKPALRLNKQSMHAHDKKPKERPAS